MKKSRNAFLRMGAWLLVLCLMVTLLPSRALASETVRKEEVSLNRGDSIEGTDYHVVSKRNYSIAPDIKETVYITNNNSGTSQTVANVMEVNTSNGNATIVTGYGNLNPSEDGWTMKTMTNQAHLFESEYGYNVVGGVNASWFNINTGEPSGYLVMNGVVHHDNSSRAYVAAFSDGSVNVFKQGTLLSEAERMQSAKVGKTVTVVEAVDGYTALVWDGKVYEPGGGNEGGYSRAAVGIKEDGTVVLFQADGTMAPRSVGYTAYEEAEFLVSLGCVAAIRLDEGGSATYLSQREGEGDLSLRNVPAGGDERIISGSILVVSKVKETGEFDHVRIMPNEELFTPNSTIEFIADAMDISSNLTHSMPKNVLFELDETCKNMGEISNITISDEVAAFSFISNGVEGNIKVNAILDGTIVGSTIVSVVLPNELTFISNEVNLSYEAVSDLGLRAFFNGEEVILKDGDIEWSISDTEAGRFIGTQFVATDNTKYSGSPTVSASVNGMTKSVVVNIGKQPVTILDGGDNDVWDYSTIGTTVESFTGMSSSAVATYHYAGRGGIVKGSVISDTDDRYSDIVRFGHNAIRLDYDWTNIVNTDGACLGLGSDLDIEGTPTAIGVWVYIPEGVPVPWLRAQIATNMDGKKWTNAYVNFSSGSATGEGLTTGWQYLEADLTQYSGAKIRVNSGMLFRAMVTLGGIGWYTPDGEKLPKADLKGYIIIDNLQIVYGANNQDTTKPHVSSIQLINEDGTKSEISNGFEISKSNLNFYVTYDDNEATDPYAEGIESAYFYIDGKYYGEGIKDVAGSMLTGVHLANGSHSIMFYLKDGYGNVTREVRYFNVNDATSSVPTVFLHFEDEPNVGSEWGIMLDTETGVLNMEAAISISKKYAVKNVIFENAVDSSFDYDSSTGLLNIKARCLSNIEGLSAKVIIDVPANLEPDNFISVQILKGSYEYEGGNTTFSSENKAFFVSSAYDYTNDELIYGMGAMLYAITSDGECGDNIMLLVDGEEYGYTGTDGVIDISSLTNKESSYKLQLKGKNGYSFVKTLVCYKAAGNDEGRPYYVHSGVTSDACSKAYTWLSNPIYTEDKAYVKVSIYDDMKCSQLFEGSTSLVSFGKTGDIVRTNNVEIFGLSEDTTYYYQVGDGLVWSDIDMFKTTNGKKDESKFFILADIQDKAAIDGMERIASIVGNQEYDFGIQLGDAVDNVSVYDQWKDALDLFDVSGIRETDFIHVIGNHEADDGNHGAYAAKQIFGITDDWYSVEIGNVYVAVLNYTMKVDKLNEFKRWLIEDASKTDCAWKVVVSHVPVYYTNPTGGGETYLDMLPNALDEAGIDFYFSGNDHSYARTAPLSNGLVSDEGTVYYIAGTTGGKSYSIVNNPNFHFEIATLDFESVYLSVESTLDEITVNAVNVLPDGTYSVFDSYTKEKKKCADDEHSYIYDSITDLLSCSVCGYRCYALECMYPGTAIDKYTGDILTFVAGKIYIAKNGIIDVDGVWYYYENDVKSYAGLIKIDDYYYYVKGDKTVVRNRRYEITKTNNLLPAGYYDFDEEGHLLLPEKKNGIINENGSLYYYIEGNIVYAGLIAVNSDYYYVRGNGQLAVGKYYVTKNNGLLPSGEYEFDEKGRMIISQSLDKKNGIIEENGILFYYLNGMKNYAGLVEIDGDYYYVNGNCRVVTGEYYVTKTNDIMPVGYYMFDDSGRMVIQPEIEKKNGIVSEEGALYYYLDGERYYAGLIQIEDKFYYVRGNGQLATGMYYVTKNNDILPSAYYEFDEMGCMILQDKNVDDLCDIVANCNDIEDLSISDCSDNESRDMIETEIKCEEIDSYMSGSEVTTIH